MIAENEFVPDPSPNAIDPSPEFTWVSSHFAELLAQYAGQWIAVHGDRVIAHGLDAREVASCADRIVPPGEALFVQVTDYADMMW
ncbi:MAG: DUF5678 domain-containing protein [Phycisphaerae bacterium]